MQMRTLQIMAASLSLAQFVFGQPAGDGGAKNSRLPLRTASSSNKRFALHIEAGPAEKSDKNVNRTGPVGIGDTAEQVDVDRAAPVADGQPDGGEAEAGKAEEPKRDGKAGRRERQAEGRLLEGREERWRVLLVNEVAPVRAFVRDDGLYVVTLDEFGVGGARHAIAVYDGEGTLVRELSLREVLTRTDWRRVRARRGVIEWLRGAKFAFEPDPERFVITLRPGRKVEIDLAGGRVLGGVGADAPAAEGDIPADALAALDGKAGEADGPETLEAGDALDENLAQSLLDQEMERLAQLLARQSAGDSSPELAAEIAAAQASAEEIRARLQGEQAAAELDAAAAGDADADAPNVEVSEPTSVAQAVMEFASGDDRQTALGQTLEPGVQALAGAGNSAEIGLAVPPADPAHPANYLEWFNRMSTPAGPNAAPVYVEAFAKLKKWGEEDDDLFQAAIKGDPDALKSEKVQAWLAQSADAFRLGRDASKLDFKGFGANSTDGRLINILLPNAANVRTLGRGLVIDGKQRELNGDYAGAIRDYMDVARIGGQTSQAPTLIENLVGIAVQSQASEAMLDAFEKAGESGMDYAAVAAQLEQSYGRTRPVQETFQFERAMILDLMQSAYEYDAEAGAYKVSETGVKNISQALGQVGDNPLSDIAMSTYFGAVGFEKLAETVNRHYDRMSAAAAMPYSQGQAALGALESEIANPAFRAANPVLSQLLPALSRASAVSQRGESQRRATLLMANIRAYKQNFGEYPKSLDIFGGRDFVTDPLSGQPFVYRPDGGSFSLYSVGLNGTDEGGVHDPVRNTNDTVFWPRPAKP